MVETLNQFGRMRPQAPPEESRKWILSDLEPEKELKKKTRSKLNPVNKGSDFKT